jgi:hypothetical protein
MSKPSHQEDRQAVPDAHNVKHCQYSHPLDLVHLVSARPQTMSMYAMDVQMRSRKFSVIDKTLGPRCAATQNNLTRQLQPHILLHSVNSVLQTMAFEPSLSTSGMRPPLASADAPSMADSLPSINFGFEDLRNRMAQFTIKFDAFIERGRKQVLEERNQSHINLAELEGMISRFVLLIPTTNQDGRGRADATTRH